MEKCGELCDSHSHNKSKLSATNCIILRENQDSVQTICDRTTNVTQCKSEKLRKRSVIQKYRIAYLKRYVYAKGLKRCRRLKKTFIIPVIHVSRRPDNPFNVKIVVENLRKDQMTCPLNTMSETNQHLHIGSEECYSQLETKQVNTKNRESIRYKYQLDYRENIKMQRERFLKEYAERRKLSKKHQKEDHIGSLHQNMEDRINEVSRNAVVAKEILWGPTPQSNLNQHMGDNQSYLKATSESQAASSKFSGRSNLPEKTIQFYYAEDEGKHICCDSIDLTKDNETSNSDPRSEVSPMRFVRNKRASTTFRNKTRNASGTLLQSDKEELATIKKTQHNDFDFTIPFNESKILVKVMTPEERNPINATTQPGSLLQETLEQNAEPKQKINAPKRVSFDEEPKAKTARLDSGSGNQRIQHLQNILNTNCIPQKQYVNQKVAFDHSVVLGKPVEKKTQSNNVKSKNFVDHRPIPNTAPIQRSNGMNVNEAVQVIPPTTNYYDPSSTGRLKQDQPVVTNPRLVRPKVMHPSPYFRSDSMRTRAQFNDQLEDPIGRIGVPLQQHTRVTTQISDAPPNTAPHMEYFYGNPNYHHDYNMIRNRRVPLDIPHPSLIGQPVYSMYDHAYVQYRNEMERIPPCGIDPYIQHNMHVPPFNPNVGFLSARPAAPGAYGYLNPQQVHHPVWIYPHYA